MPVGQRFWVITLALFFLGASWQTPLWAQPSPPLSRPQLSVRVSPDIQKKAWFQGFKTHLARTTEVLDFQIAHCVAAVPVLNLHTDPLPQGCQTHPSQMLNLRPSAENLYAYLQHLGYRFWHPLQPMIPEQISSDRLTSFNAVLPEPALGARGFIPHTMHPIELSHVLNGWGLTGVDSRADWEALLPQWAAYLEWLVAHRQNKVEWVLLEKGRWRHFSRSAERQERLRILVQMAHQWGIKVGVDVPMALQQQNGWRLIQDATGSPEQVEQQIEQSLDWLMGAHFDFVSTEMGSTEFSNGGAKAMVHSLNHATQYLADRYQRPFSTKVHISSGQTTTDYRDPSTGQPLNYNFLPLFADPRLGVLPHTVQVYALDDPAPTYGQQDFGDMLRFMQYVSAQNRQRTQQRPMYWYPETAYWVNYDNHVPLFLPVYAHRRLHDLHLLHHKAVDLTGQMVFTSGWSWGYWLNDVLSANSAVTPLTHASEASAMEQLLQQEFSVFGQVAPQLIALLQDTMQVQYELLILGQINGKAPKDPVKRNGMAYLSGQETWSQLGALIRQWGLTGFQTQPDRWHFNEVAQDAEAAQAYRNEVRPLLQAMDTQFSALARRADALQTQVSGPAMPYFQEIQRGLWINVYRTRLVQDLFEAALGRHYRHPETTRRYLARAHDMLDKAQALVKAQHGSLPAPWVVAAPHHRPNPTAYTYGYLWPADALYYWRRDLQQVEQKINSPCLMNIIDPLEVAFPDPEAEDLAQGVKALLKHLPFWRDCVELKK